MNQQQESAQNEQMQVNSDLVVNNQPKQNNTLVITLSILLLISISVSGYFAYQTLNLKSDLSDLRTPKTLNNQTIISENSDIDSNFLVGDSDSSLSKNFPKLKSYINKRYEYSIRYPSSWKVVEGKMLTDGKIFICSSCGDEITEDLSTNNSEIIIYTLEDEDVSKYFNSSTIEEITIDTQKAYKAIFDKTSELPSNIATKILIPSRGLIYVIEVKQPTVGVGYDLKYDEIINTFKFTN